MIVKAIELLEEHGAESLTTRRLGAALDVRAPALYGHIENRPGRGDRGDRDVRGRCARGRELNRTSWWVVL